MRVFLALVPPAAARLQLRFIMSGFAGARWQSDAQLHITLRFIGEIDRHMANALVDSLDYEQFDAPTGQLDGLGHFAKKGMVSALWAGLAPREPMLHLHQRLDRICVRLGMEPDGRRFLPHITLARFSRRSAPHEDELARYLSVTPLPAIAPFLIDRLVLFESTLGQSGSVYTELAHFPLHIG